MRDRSLLLFVIIEQHNYTDSAEMDAVKYRPATMNRLNIPGILRRALMLRFPQLLLKKVLLSSRTKCPLKSKIRK